MAVAGTGRDTDSPASGVMSENFPCRAIATTASKHPPAAMFKAIRIAVLLFILAIVAVNTWRTQATAVKWKYALPVNVYPINGDGSAAAQAYMRTLKAEDFKAIESFMQSEAARHGRAGATPPVEVRLGDAIDAVPPLPPLRGGRLEVAMWSLKMRWWAYRHGQTTGPGTQVKIYLLYFDPARTQRLDHSVALQKGLIGLVKVFATADMAAQNNVVIAHEFLHTLGATDKYDLATGLPHFPDGYAEPGREPPLPQRIAEIMGGRIPLAADKAEQPASLNRVLIGEKTAQEINWLASP